MHLNVNKLCCKTQTNIFLFQNLQAYFQELSFLKQAIFSTIQAGHASIRQKRTAGHTLKRQIEPRINSLQLQSKVTLPSAQTTAIPTGQCTLTEKYITLNSVF